jgi:ABC-type polysaccharide/polyol phosphate transport system ATPase subunit
VRVTERVVFDKVTVDFPIYGAASRSLRHRLVLNRVQSMVRKPASVGGNMRQEPDGVVTVRALDSVSFTLVDGDRLALLGHNGAGKTTILRVAAGIYEPLVGEVVTRGRIMPLFNMMEGMALDATGTEMVRARGTLLGLSEDEIREKASEIADFCELGEYMDMPVRTYSTGMLVRLAFAITTAVTADILIMDEFIGAGDAAFFERAQQRLKRFVEHASVLLVATHSPDVARQWCNRAILMEHGRVAEHGPVEDVVAAYARRNAGG